MGAGIIESVTQSTGLIFDMRRFSVHDGPGIRTTVFFKGCPLRCWWCHNPESQLREPEIMVREARCMGCLACLDACQHEAISAVDGRAQTDLLRCARCGECIPSCPADAREWVGSEASLAQVMREIERDVAFYDESGGGVTISGGEPLLQPAFLVELLRACRAREIHTALDTSGYASWETLDRVRPWVDLFLYDVKCIDDDLHQQVTGVSNARILRNLRELSSRGHRIVLRVPLIPNVNADVESMRALAALAQTLPGVERIDLLPYHHAAAGKYERLRQSYLLANTQPPPASLVEDLAQLLCSAGFSVKIGG